jgi:hypothetical protein
VSVAEDGNGQSGVEHLQNCIVNPSKNKQPSDSKDKSDSLDKQTGKDAQALQFTQEFDPGSGRTLAACLTHASRTESTK